MMRPSIRISMLSYSHITTFVRYKRASSAMNAAKKPQEVTCCKFLKITFYDGIISRGKVE